MCDSAALPLPGLLPETFVVATPFPPDDRSICYERGTYCLQSLDEATTAAALEAAVMLRRTCQRSLGSRRMRPTAKNRLQAFCASSVERAFRRAPVGGGRAVHHRKTVSDRPDLETAVKRVIFTLKSPRFLYREIDSRRLDATMSPHVCRFGLWDSLPDPELLRRPAQARSPRGSRWRGRPSGMVADPRAWNKLREFLLFWLKTIRSRTWEEHAKVSRLRATVALGPAHLR